MAPFKERVYTWDRYLKTLSELLSEWIRAQNYWLYLQPIFASDDISSQLPTETRNFAFADNDYKKTMKVLNDNLLVLYCVSSDTYV